jgi:hypothetical protein
VSFFVMLMMTSRHEVTRKVYADLPSVRDGDRREEPGAIPA